MNKTFASNMDPQHLILTQLSQAVYIKGDTDPVKAALLHIQEAASTEDQRRWAYFCAGLSSSQTEAVLAREWQLPVHPTPAQKSCT